MYTIMVVYRVDRVYRVWLVYMYGVDRINIYMQLDCMQLDCIGLDCIGLDCMQSMVSV